MGHLVSPRVGGASVSQSKRGVTRVFRYVPAIGTMIAMPAWAAIAFLLPDSLGLTRKYGWRVVLPISVILFVALLPLFWRAVTNLLWSLRGRVVCTGCSLRYHPAFGRAWEAHWEDIRYLAVPVVYTRKQPAIEIGLATGEVLRVAAASLGRRKRFVSLVREQCGLTAAIRRSDALVVYERPRPESGGAGYPALPATARDGERADEHPAADRPGLGPDGLDRARQNDDACP